MEAISNNDDETELIPEPITAPYYRFKEWPQYVDTLITIGFFIGLLFIWPLINRMEINFGTFLVNGSYAFFAMLIVTQLYRMSFTIRRLESIDFMRIILLAPFISMLIFVVNFSTPGEKITEQYLISNFKVREISRQKDEVQLILKDLELQDYPKMRTFEIETNTMGWKFILYEFEKGIFGYKNLKSRTIILENGNQIKF